MLMNPEQRQKAVEEAHENGAEIEFIALDTSYGPDEWTLTKFPVFSWDMYDYRLRKSNTEVDTRMDNIKEAQTHVENALSLTEVMLSKRQKTHGDFIDHARVTWRLKQVLKDESEIMGKSLSPVQIEALEMICHKIGRIFAGNPDFLDHWDDIAGYAMLVAKNLRQQTGQENENGK